MATTAMAGEKIQFGNLIEKGISDQKTLDQKMAGLIEDASYKKESKEVLDFVQEELDYLNKQNVVDNHTKTKSKKDIY